MNRKLHAAISICCHLTAGSIGLIAITTESIAQHASSSAILLAEVKPGATDKGPDRGASPASRHVESVNYDHWMVTCQDAAEGSNKVCVAYLRILGPNGKDVLVNWQIGFDKAKHLMSVFQVPTGFTRKTADNKAVVGVMVKKGLDVKLGNADAHHLDFITCNPKSCEAAIPIEEVFRKEANGAASTEITIYSSDGTSAPLSFDSRGLDKALRVVASQKF
jgi:invasion protein IalB